MARFSGCCFTVGRFISPAYMRSQLISWTDSEDYAFLLGLLYSRQAVSSLQDSRCADEVTSSDAALAELILNYAVDTQRSFASEATVPLAGAAASVHVTRSLEATPSDQAPAAAEAAAACQSLIEAAAIVAFRNVAPTLDLPRADLVAGGFRRDTLSDCAVTSASLAVDIPFQHRDTNSPGGDTFSWVRADEERENALLVLQGVENWLLVDMCVSQDEPEHAHQKQELQLKFLHSLGYDVTGLIIEEVARIGRKVAETGERAVLADLGDDMGKVGVDSDTATVPTCSEGNASLDASLATQGENFLSEKEKESQALLLKEETRQRATRLHGAPKASIAKKEERISPTSATRNGVSLRCKLPIARRKQGKQHWRPCASYASRDGGQKTGKGNSGGSRHKGRTTFRSNNYIVVSKHYSSSRSAASDNTSDSMPRSSRRTSVTTRSSSRRSSASDNPSINADML